MQSQHGTELKIIFLCSQTEYVRLVYVNTLYYLVISGLFILTGRSPIVCVWVMYCGVCIACTQEYKSHRIEYMHWRAISSFSTICTKHRDMHGL